MTNGTHPFVETIVSADPEVRNRSFWDLCSPLSTEELLESCQVLEKFRRQADNLYERVRATLFLYAIYRFFLSESADFADAGKISYRGYSDLLMRRYEEAIDAFHQTLNEEGPNGSIFSALAECYHHLSFQTLFDQVRRSVRSSLGNQWMFRVGHTEECPVRIRPEMLERQGSLLYPILRESTPVRLDLSHSCWSDIFFLGMDYPEFARVLNISVDFGVYKRDNQERPPIETYVRVIPEPLLRITSVDLDATKDITELSDLFNFGNDYLGLLKAGIIASGMIAPAFEGTEQELSAILERIIGPGMGLELVTNVNDIPKGSRLAVSTNLLASIIAALMRATGQTTSIDRGLTEDERRLVASRAILGEWLGGSGGGWQDSGGVWPGLKVITGAVAKEGDPEFGISRGCLLPRHTILGDNELHPEITQRLADSLVLVHGGMAQNVGPILEMVTEKYLLRMNEEWVARIEAREIFDGILEALKRGDVRALAAWTTENWEGPLKTIIPWVTNHFTETIIARARNKYGDKFWGFLMLGGMSGGGMGMFVAPECRDKFRDDLLAIMLETKKELEDALPFAMDPVVYNFQINERGTDACILSGDEAVMPSRYHAVQIPNLAHSAPESINYVRRAELDLFIDQRKEPEETFSALRKLVSHLFRVTDSAGYDERREWDVDADAIKKQFGFDEIQHEQIRSDIQAGRIGLVHNRLPVDTDIRDVKDTDVCVMEDIPASAKQLGDQALKDGRVAVLSLGGGVGSRWTSGAGVVKTVNPFVYLEGKHRSFLEIHVAKTRRTATRFGTTVPHIISTSYLTHDPISRHLEADRNYGYKGPAYLSPGRSISQRLIPMVRDLVFLWEEMPQEMLDEQKQKMRNSVRGALMNWARETGEGSDYTDNMAVQRFSPPGHWYEVPNMLRNGVLARVLEEHPQIDTILLHNIDTLGADLDPTPLGMHLSSGNALTFEVVPRRIEDHGGGLARVNGKVRLMEGLAQPREEDEFRLRYYNSMTTWIQVDPFLELFGLTRKDLCGPEHVLAAAVRKMAARMPTYVTIKDVKRRWGHGQEDIYPVAQFEKLWSDMTALPEINCGYIVVPRLRGQQLKAPDQLDAWVTDGSRNHIVGLGEFT